ncbi:MAG: DUF2075 domain-containing protein [Elusimicrobia bacterium]|nr:DUF2075 domain-containing protein [Elusimicrobiota bacterium]
MKREFYSSSINDFCLTDVDSIIGFLTEGSIKSGFPVVEGQYRAWEAQIEILKKNLKRENGKIYFEYSIPRMGRRVDSLLIIKNAIFLIEFKLGNIEFSPNNIEQVLGYALDLSNFHETSHNKCIVPILVATKSELQKINIAFLINHKNILKPIKCSPEQIIEVINKIVDLVDYDDISIENWENGRYSPSPNIVEAAVSLYRGHNVTEISRNDAGAINLSKTSSVISEIIEYSKLNRKKSICFVTGVPGSGKTLVGLNIATNHINKNDELYSVFLSGNGPLVSVLREALVRDKVIYEKSRGNKIRKGEIFSEVKMFIQNVHNFRDDCLIDTSAPKEHVAVFDEAQRAWDNKQTFLFMKRKKNNPNFNQSEPEFLVSCMDRHKDWAVIVCLVGGGQEINTGEAGIGEWIDSILRRFKNWEIYLSPNLNDSEYRANYFINKIEKELIKVKYEDELHLSVSLRSFRSEQVSELIKNILDINIEPARNILKSIVSKYPIVITRDFQKAKNWLKSKASGMERYGVIVSSQAERLKPYAINVKSTINPINWFLSDKNDVRSSYYLEDVATEFHVQGLELDWTCVAWDADFRYTESGWENWSFKGNKWFHINNESSRNYQKNAYRVILTRARQGMIIFVPNGEKKDSTRKPEFYDSTYKYLKQIGIKEI